MKFKEWIEVEGFKIDKIAEKIGISRQALSYLINGHHVPSLKVAVKIEKLTKGKVKCKDWIDELGDNQTKKDDSVE